MRCAFCGSGRVNRPRGLCWRCYYTPGVRDRFASGNPRGNRPEPEAVPVRPAACPTDAEPGTPEKVEVMAARAARGEAIFHPKDRRRAG